VQRCEAFWVWVEGLLEHRSDLQQVGTDRRDAIAQ
jgi:hypothetical protein